MRVLVVEDDVLIRLWLTEVLSDAGFETLEASDGRIACSLIDDPDDIDLVVTDLYLPGANGIAVAEKARRKHPDVPVLVVSAHAGRMWPQYQKLPYRFLLKPFSEGDLIRAVRGTIPSV